MNADLSFKAGRDAALKGVTSMERREFLKKMGQFSAVAGSVALWGMACGGKRYINAYSDGYPDGYDDGYGDSGGCDGDTYDDNYDDDGYDYSDDSGCSSDGGDDGGCDWDTSDGDSGSGCDFSCDGDEYYTDNTAVKRGRKRRSASLACFMPLLVPFLLRRILRVRGRRRR